MNRDLSSLLPPVIAIARKAGHETLAVYAQDFDIGHKADRSPVTEADLRAQQVILQDLRLLTPDVPVLSEESAVAPFSERGRWREFWLVDPLDGTREFIAKSPEFTVNIALIREGKPVLGVVHVPVQGLDYYAAQGIGAFRQMADSGPAAIRVAATAHSPLRVLGSKSHRGNSLDAVLGRLGACEIRPAGSSLTFCLSADASADLYPRLGPTSEWDTAAGQAVVECAGGRVVDLTGRPLRYNTRETLINPDFVAFGDLNRDWLSYF